MAYKRPSNKVLERLHADLAQTSEHLAEMRVFADAKDTDFWKHISAKLSAKLTVIESGLDDYLKASPDQRIALLETRKNLRFFLGIVDDMTHDIPLMEQRKRVLQEKIAEYDARIRKG